MGNGNLTRADLAVRLREVEACWERYRASESARLRAAQPLSEAVSAFFTNRLDRLAYGFTLACARLRSEGEPTAEMLYAGSVGLRVPPIVSAGRVRLSFEPFRYYEAQSRPLEALWQVETRAGRRVKRGRLELPLNTSPEVELRLPEGDYQIRFELKQARQTLRAWVQPLSAIIDAAGRIERLRAALALAGDADPLASATVRMAVEVLEAAVRGDHPESFYPLRRLLLQAESIVRQRPHRWQPQSGDHWLATLTGGETVYFRFYLPSRWRVGQPLPLVIALHGAGGNEHLFFDGYGLGRILKEAERRNWAVTAPRTSLSLRHLWGTLDTIQQRVAIDERRLYLMGHSMGGAQAFAALAQKPAVFRAAAIFAGAGQPTTLAPELALFLAVGEQELPFLKTNVERAFERLKTARLRRLEYRMYRGCEHLMIVREALPDAFAFLERYSA